MGRRNFKRSTSGEGNVIDMNTLRPVEKPAVPVICERIRHYRELSGMEQKEMAARIGITGNSVCNWEKGRGRPDINLIPQICSILNISLYDLFGMKDPAITLSAHEQLHMDTYLRLTKEHRYVVDNLINSLMDIQLAKECRNISELPFYGKSLAAGIGDPTEFEEHFTPLYLYTDNIDKRADCVFKVNGDSMEPDFYDGDLVLAERIPGGSNLKEGETGAFIIGNEMYIKKLGHYGLESANPNYAPIYSTDSDPVYLVGRILGTIDPEKDIASDPDIEKYKAINGKNSKNI